MNFSFGNRLRALGAIALTGLAAHAYTADDIIDMAIENNAVKLMRQQENAEILNLQSANSLPGPEVEFESLWASGAVSRWSLTVSQGFDWPGLYAVRRRQSAARAMSAAWKVESARTNLRLETVSLLIRAAYIKRRIETIDRMAHDMSELAEYLDEALEHGLVTILDKKKTAIEQVTLDIERDKQSADLDEVLSRLCVVTGSKLTANDINTDITARFLEPSDLETYIARLETDCPEIQLAKSLASAAQLGIDEAKMASLPSFSVGYKHEKEDFTHFNGFTVSVTLPSWGFRKSAAAARAQATTAEAQATYLIDSERLRIENEFNSAVSLRDNIARLHKNGIDGDYLSLLNQARQGGEISILDYLREQSYCRTVTIEMLDLEEQYCLLLASLNRYSL